MKITKKVFKVIMLILLITILSSQFVGYSNALSLREMYDKANQFKTTGESAAGSILNEQTLQDEFVPIGQILVTIGTAVLAIVTVIMAIKYITANPEQKGKLKQQLIGLVVSIVVIYGAVGIWTLIKNFMEGTGL